MIILKILLWIILAILGIILLVMIVPAGAEFGYIDKKLTYKISYGVFNLYDSGGKGIARWLINKRKNKKSDSNDDGDDLPDIDEPEEPEEFDEFEMPEPDEVFDNDDSESEEVIEVEEVVEVSDEKPKKPKREKKSKPEKKSEKKPKKSKSSEETEEPDEEPDKLEEIEKKLDFALDLLRAMDDLPLRILKGIKFSKVYIDFMIANEDAFKCAVDYGAVSGTMYNLLGYMSAYCTVSFKTVDIFPAFNQKESRWDISAKVSFKPITMVVAGLGFLLTYIFRFFIPQKLQERKLKKATKTEK